MAEPLEHLRTAIADQYTLGEEIGRGGMAVVFAAEDLRHHRQVAIKILHPELAAAVGVERFTREIEIAARLSHPHIVPLFDSGGVDGILYYVMPLLSEGSLRGRLNRDKQIPLGEAVRIINETAAGLDFAHEAGVIHRDIKPANIMFSGGEVMLADFGVATAVAAKGGEALTATGLAVGTPAYMSPEQSAGVHDVEARSDVYALGCVAYEMLAGSPPFEGPTPQAVQARKMSGEVQSLRVVRDTVPPAAERVIRKALAPTPADRYATAGELAAALRGAIASPEGTRPGVAGRPGRRDTRRKLAVIGGAAVIALAIWHFGLGGLPGTVRPAAASFFQERDRVVVSDFQNQTADEAVGLAMRQAVITDLHQSPHVSVVDYAELGQVFRRMQIPDTSRLTPRRALEVARREGYPAVIGGAITPLGTGFLMTGEIVEASTGEVVVRVSETADDREAVLEAVERLSHLLRRHLGESLLSLRRSRPLPEVTTPSLEALELYALGIERSRHGDHARAIPLLERAASIDTGFASAYRSLATVNGNSGRMAQAQAAIDKAYSLQNRMPDRERYVMMAYFYKLSGDADSAAYNYELLLELEPEQSTAINNLGDLYEDMGRFEEALAMYRRSMELNPGSGVPPYNVASAARTLGMHATADSALVTLQELFPGSVYALAGEAYNAYYRGDFDSGEPAARQVIEQYPGYPAGVASLFFASIAAERGHIQHAMALADSSAESFTASGAAFMAAPSLFIKTLAAWVGGRAGEVVPDLNRALESPEVGALRWEHAKLGTVALGYALAGRYAQARQLLPRLDSLSAAGHTFLIEEDARAVLALAEGDPEGALTHVRQARARDFGIERVVERLLTGDAHAALGQWEQAAEAYERLLSSYRVHWRDIDSWATLLPLAHERLGETYLALADTARAVQHLEAFAEMWRDADPELQPRVTAARDRAAQLAAGLGN